MLKMKSVTAFGTVALALILSFGATSLQAAACKGLESGPCQKNDNCSWVKPYQRKDGVKVAGYCKSKPSKSGKSGGPKKSDDKKKTESKKKSESKE